VGLFLYKKNYKKETILKILQKRPQSELVTQKGPKSWADP
jgi:hypothetical protein